MTEHGQGVCTHVADQRLLEAVRGHIRNIDSLCAGYQPGHAWYDQALDWLCEAERMAEGMAAIQLRLDDEGQDLWSPLRLEVSSHQRHLTAARNLMLEFLTALRETETALQRVIASWEQRQGAIPLRTIFLHRMIAAYRGETLSQARQANLSAGV